MIYKSNWQETKNNLKLWWKGENKKPIVYIAARKTEGYPPYAWNIEDERERYMNVEKIVEKNLHYFNNLNYDLAEGYPYIDLNLGPGSLALYLDSEPIFKPDTVWYTECMEDYSKLPVFDPQSPWLRAHLDMFRQAKKIAPKGTPFAIPDLLEGIDILSAMRGPMNFCYDIIDYPEDVHRHMEALEDVFFKCYDLFYEELKDEEGGSFYTAFFIWGPGKTAKVQCDFNNVMSPSQFDEFCQPYLVRQCARLDNTLFHLDGPEAIRHLDSILKIPDLGALQFTPGTAAGGYLLKDEWLDIYEKVRRAGKSVWIALGGDIDSKLESIERAIKRLGGQGIYFIIYSASEEEAQRILELIDRLS